MKTLTVNAKITSGGPCREIRHKVGEIPANSIPVVFEINLSDLLGGEIIGVENNCLTIKTTINPDLFACFTVPKKLEYFAYWSETEKIFALGFVRPGFFMKKS